MACLLLFLVLHIVVSANGFFNPYPKVNANLYDDGDSGEPLFLTPYIESGKIEEARNLSRVHFPGFPKLVSYAGFFTVDKTHNSNQFLWYFPAKIVNVDKLPNLYLWLQGGPGASSLFGLFDENGPIEVKNGSFHEREFSWNRHDHLIYIDNPVGAGFSFTDDSRGYCTNQTQIGEHLYTTLIQFFQLFPELQSTKFFISGESYAGKYIPALGYTIHKMNPSATVKINLNGLIIGDGWCDPINQLDYSDYLYQIGFIDSQQKIKLEDFQNTVIHLIEIEAWFEAYKVFNLTLQYIQEIIGTASIYNYMKEVQHGCDYCELIQSAEMRRAIHVGNLTFGDSNELVRSSLSEDFMQSVAPWISELLEHYHILFYNGQLDIIVAYPLTVNFLKKLEFSGSEEYLNAKRMTNLGWFSRSPRFRLIGYSKTTGNNDLLNGKLTEMWIRNAGHMAAADQPIWVNLLIRVWSWRLDDLSGSKS